MRSLDLTSESPASVEQFHVALSTLEYWRARLAVNDSGTATLDSLTVDADGTVDVVTTLNPLRDRLPGPIARLHRGDLEILHTETWSLVDGGRLRGRVSYEMSGVPLSGSGTVLLTPLDSPDQGSHLSYTVTVEVRVPLVGGAIERLIGTQLPAGILAGQRFTAEWIAENS